MQYDKELKQFEENLSILKAFCHKYGDKLPELLVSLSGNMSGEQPYASAYLRYSDDETRDRALQLLGELFGRQGWTGKQDRGDEYHDWFKIIDSVKFTIYGAKQSPPTPPEYKVQPTEFPLLLEATSDASH